VFIILKQIIGTVKVETDVSIDNEEDVIGMETDAVCVPQECEPEVSHIWSLFFVVVVVDIYCCVWFCTHGTTEIG
jgi:hypothetical protein